jgi:hypothetical protein
MAGGERQFMSHSSLFLRGIALQQAGSFSQFLCACEQAVANASVLMYCIQE